MPGSYRFLVLVMFACFGIVAVLLVVVNAIGRSGGPPVVATCLWITAMGWNAYWFLFRIAYELESDGDRLRWRAPLRSGEMALADLTGVRSRSSVGVISGASQQRVLVWVRKGFVQFTEAMVAARPDLRVRIGFRARLVERWPGRSGYRRLG